MSEAGFQLTSATASLCEQVLPPRWASVSPSVKWTAWSFSAQLLENLHV